MNSESVDLIYLDPPFNSGKQWENPIGADGKKAVASFKDTWSPADIHIDDRYELGQLCPQALPFIASLRQINGDSWWAYLIYMGVRLVEMKRILKPTGGIYYHCDPTMSHGIKLLMDAIFGGKNFINEIVWHYTGGTDRSVGFQRKHDIILYYGKTQTPVFNPVYVPFADTTIKRFNKIDEEGRRYKINQLADGRVTKTYMKDDGKLAPDHWNFSIVNRTYKESTGYPTQKPLALLERIIKASSNEGDVVLDPFCGCATTCIAAEHARRQWIGIDLSHEAASIVYNRLRQDTESPLADPEAVVTHETKLPKRTDLLPVSDKSELKADLHHRQHGKCVLCLEDIPVSAMDLDHIIPRVRGGQDISRNYQLLCSGCNSRKGGKPMETARKEAVSRRVDEQEKSARDEWENRNKFR